MRLLVTGGAGFIGSNFVHYCIEETDHNVITLDALTYAGDKNNLQGVLDHERHRFVEGNVRDRELVNELVLNVDAVVNFAAESHVDRSINGAADFVATNVGGTQTLLAAVTEHGIDRFLQVSTDEVYGHILEGEFSEDDCLEPRNPYAATKAGADLLCQSYARTYELPVVIVRSSNNYGPRQHDEKLIPKFIQLADKGDELPVYGDGKNVREWTYVKDSCRAFELVLREGDVGEIYNVGSGEERQNIEVTRRIVDLVGAEEDQITFVKDRPGHDQRYALETGKIETLGWEAEWTFDKGIKATVQYYCD